MTHVDRFKVGLAQLNSELGNVQANLERAMSYIARAAQELEDCRDGLESPLIEDAV